MTTTLRRFLALGGSVVLGVALGRAADAAGVTPYNDGDMTTTGLLAGAGLGLAVMALVRDDSR